MRGFDIDHRIEGLVGEGQVFGVALHEIQSGQLVLFPAEVDTRRVQVQTRIGGRVQGAHKVRGSAAVPATDLEHLLATKINLGRCAVIELDAKPVGLIGRRQRQGHRRILLVGPVDEQRFIGAHQAGSYGIGIFRYEFHDVGTASGAQAVNDGHGLSMARTRNVKQRSGR